MRTLPTEGNKRSCRALITFGGQPVRWYIRKQEVVALSITEAENIADGERAKDAAWVRQLQVQTELQKIRTISGKENQVDILTKLTPISSNVLVGGLMGEVLVYTVSVLCLSLTHSPILLSASLLRYANE